MRGEIVGLKARPAYAIFGVAAVDGVGEGGFPSAEVGVVGFAGGGVLEGVVGAVAGCVDVVEVVFCGHGARRGVGEMVEGARLSQTLYLQMLLKSRLGQRPIIELLMCETSLEDNSSL